MPGIFILSLDCEGKWGIADQLNESHREFLSDARLRVAYASVVALLDQFGLSATFAFTSLFTLPPNQLRALPGEEISYRLPYTVSAFNDFKLGLFEGWSAPWARDMVTSRHEIACHGVTHTPWDSMDEEQAKFELALVSLTENHTFVFPRNRVRHLELLSRAGFRGYRLAPSERSRVLSLMSEFNIFAAAEKNPSIVAPQSIPAGYFINWLSGLRRSVPLGCTRLRVRHILEDAARSCGVAHFWTHPENIATAPETLLNLRTVLEEVARLRAQNKIICMTQSQYCDHLSAMAP
ncbi:hypothetical protein [Candidatus Aalborgicola defluviihabitans]|uniref:hypothetical protein n=1 Tax=Candidatus Aalborgicola defluviihabitans TaxID=3386187 RepID=UPI003909F327|nr:polysaccharide deacetylase family protein [Burkholderiales bacterium]